MNKKEIKLVQFQLAALSILATKSEMDASALKAAIEKRMEPKSLGVFDRVFGGLSAGYFYGNMAQLGAEGFVKSRFMRSPDAKRDAELRFKERLHYSLTDNGASRRRQLSSDLDELAKKDGGKFSPGIPKPAGSFLMSSPGF